MPADTFSWLHLTDLHYGLTGQACLWPNLRQPFLDDLGTMHERCGPWDAVLFTGDLVQSGESAQFHRMHTDVLVPLWHRLTELGSGDAVLLAVPGNHDLYRPNAFEDNAAIDTLLEPAGFQRIQAKFWDNPSGAYRRVVKDAFAAYQEWWDAAPHRPNGLAAGTLPGDFAATINCGERSVGLIGLNTAFLQLGGGDYQGRLVWNARQLHALCPEGVDVWTRRHDCCLLLSHQGPDWLTLEAREHGGTEIAPPGRFAAHLFGHMHETALEYVRRGGGREAVRLCQGCSVFGMEQFGELPKIQRAHGYTAGSISFRADRTELRLWPRIATNKAGGWRFIPDHEHGVLELDEGTAPDVLFTRSRKAVAPVQPSPGGAVMDHTLAATISGPALGAAHSTLPARRPFFGRGDDLAKIAHYLSPEDRSWGVVLDGPGGVGKTALALESAHRAPTEHFPLKLWISAKKWDLHPGGQHPLQDHRVGDFYAMLAELGRALAREDIPRAVPEDRPNLIRHALSGHRVLLVLDNLETFNREEQLRAFELLGQLPGTCRAIVTSRRRVGASYAAHAIRLDWLEREAADELLAELGVRLPPVFRLTQQERDRLYAETGGNPLLLTWTAGQLGRERGRCRTVDDAIGRLQEAHRLQRINEKNDPLDFIFGDLVETFTAAETAVLAALVHFTRPAPLTWLLPLAALSEKAAEAALDDLRDRALLIEDDQAGTWLLPPLAARFLRRVRPEAVGLSGVLLVDRVYDSTQENGYSNFALFPVLEALWPQIAAALPLLMAGENRRLQAFCHALRRFLDFSGRSDEWLALNTEAESKAVAARDFHSAGWRAYDKGWCQMRRGRFVDGLACAERAAAYFERAGSGARERAAAISLRGEGHRRAEKFDAAVSDLREAVDLWRGLPGRSQDVAIGLGALAQALRSSGRIDEADTNLLQAIAIARLQDDRESIATFVGMLAESALDGKRWREAERLAREALTLSEGVGRKELIAAQCSRLAKALARQGRGDEGRCHAMRAVDVYAQLRHPSLDEAWGVLAACEHDDFDDDVR